MQSLRWSHFFEKKLFNDKLLVHTFVGEKSFQGKNIIVIWGLTKSLIINDLYGLYGKYVFK